MSWRDGLRAGSWRGVPFYCRDASNDAGQRLALFPMPGSDNPYVQPLGRGLKTYHLEIYVAGDDYMAWRDQMEAALDADGAGTLVHPYKGPLQVYAAFPCVLRERAEAGRAAFFDCVFVESGAPLPPVEGTSTATTAQQAAAQAQPLLAASYAPAYDGESASVQGAFGAALASVQGAIGGALSAVGDAASQLQIDMVTLGAIAPDDPVAYAGALALLLSNYVGLIVTGLSPAPDLTLLPGYQDGSRLPPLPPDPSYGLAGLAASSAAIVPAAATGTVLANATMLADLVQGSAALALASLYAQTGFTSSADADAARQQAHDLLLAQLEAAAGNDALVQAWRGVTTATVGDLTARAAAAPLLATLATASPLPALVLAEQLYQDGTQAAALVQRNAAPHPLFMPMTVEYLEA